MKEKIKTNNINVRLSTEEMFQLNMVVENLGISISDFVRETIQQRLTNENPEYLKKRKKELNEEIKNIEKQEELLELKKKQTKNLPQKEIEFLIETKELIEKNPLFLNGRIEKYLSDFKKTYRLSKQEFFKLLNEAEKQTK